MAYEFRRRLVHASGAVLPGAYLLDGYLGVGVVTWTLVQAVAVVGLGVTGVLELLRLRIGLDWAIYDQLTREYEQDSVAGYALYVVGGTVVVLLFDPMIAVPALFMLTIGDPISGLLSSGGFRKRPRVLAAMFLVCLAFALPFVPPVAAVAGALGATVADGFKPVVAGFVVDDNLSIPVVSSVAMWATVEIATGGIV